MNTNIEFSLLHDGSDWVVVNEEFTAKGDTFDELDRSLVDLFRESGKFPVGSRVCVFMGYDFDSFPTWLRQYHSHYFNRLVELVL